MLLVAERGKSESCTKICDDEGSRRAGPDASVSPNAILGELSWRRCGWRFVRVAGCDSVVAG